MELETLQKHTSLLYPLNVFNQSIITCEFLSYRISQLMGAQLSVFIGLGPGEDLQIRFQFQHVVTTGDLGGMDGVSIVCVTAWSFETRLRRHKNASPES